MKRASPALLRFIKRATGLAFKHSIGDTHPFSYLTQSNGYLSKCNCNSSRDQKLRYFRDSEIGTHTNDIS
ncbi:hypothetical protein QYF36_023663 [Acer negundo]|nr:hypothetical protein QYF36_023663 [Acer negundo]